jgi:3-deoxy-manno-octulosonate cytidylyltransferase (CMP-KDO synthetase)
LTIDHSPLTAPYFRFMKSIALIPARYGATRFRGKLMAELKGKSVIRHTYDATVATGLFDDVIVATDSDIIFREIAARV